MQKKERLHYLDIAKGLLIIYLPFCHFMSAAPRLGIDCSHLPSMRPFFITCFFMPAFFIVSGYCSSFSKSFPAFFSSILRSLILPCLFFQMVTFVGLGLLYDDFSYSVRVILNPPNTSLWFLSALAISKMIIYGLKKVVVNDYVILCVSILVLLMGIACASFWPAANYFAFYQSLIAVFYVFLGLFLKQHSIIHNGLVKYSPVVFLLALLCFRFTGVKIPTFAGGTISLSLYDVPFHLVLAISGSCTLFWCCRLINNNGFLEFWGRNTLVVYGMHFVILVAILKILSQVCNLNSAFDSIIFLFLVYVSLFIATFLTVKIFDHKPLKYILGK